MATPVIVGSTDVVATVPAPSGGVLAGDLIIAFAYFEPQGQGTGGATYGVVTPASGYTLASAPWPVASNDANLTTQNTNRQYCQYTWAVGGESGAIDFNNPGDWYEFNGALVIRGLSGSGTPWKEIATGHVGVTTGTVYPALSLTAGGINNLLLYLGTNWDSGNQGSKAGWTQIGDNSGTATTLTAPKATSGATGTIQPTMSAAHGPMTGALLSFRSPAVLPELVMSPMRR